MTGDLVREVAAGIYRIDANHPKPQTTCCYLIVRNQAAALIDCGGGRRGAAAVLAALKALAMAPERVLFLLVTHAHLDHAGAAGRLMQQLPQALFAAHPSAMEHLIDPYKVLAPASRALFGGAFFDAYYGGLHPVPAERARPLADGEAVMLEDRALTVLYTPGHAWHHVSFYDASTSFLIAGDAYGVSYRQLDCDGLGLLVPVMPPSQFNPQAMEESIRQLYNLQAAQAGLAHFDVIDTARHGKAYLDIQLQALQDWRQQAAALFADAPTQFRARMKEYLLAWITTRAAAHGVCGDTVRQLHDNDSTLSASGFEHYLKKTALA